MTRAAGYTFAAIASGALFLGSIWLLCALPDRWAAPCIAQSITGLLLAILFSAGALMEVES